MRKGEKRPDLYRARIGTCPVCSNEFRAVKDTYRRKQKFCSKECWSHRNPPREASCVTCNNKFSTYEKTKVYCSNECRNKHYPERFKGSASHFWKGGKTRASKIVRSSSAYAKWRKAVFERDGYACVECGAKSGKGKRVEIHADHIKPMAYHPELALEITNGRTLCAPCHKETDTWAWRARWKFTGQKAELING